MTSYSTADQIKKFITDAGPNAFFICDMDGNVVKGYFLAPGKTLPLGATDDPKKQNIPSGTSPAEIAELVRTGVLEERLFAEKAMDVRLPTPLVEILNKNVAENKPFALAFLTSRSANDALTILRRVGRQGAGTRDHGGR